MRRTPPLAGLVAGGSAVLVLLACAAAGSAAAPAGPREDIEAVLERMVEAWNADDLEGHVAPYAADATYTTPSGVQRGREAIVRILSGFRTADGLYGELRFDDVSIRPLASEHALVTGRFTLRVDGPENPTGRFTLVFARRDGRWEVIHDHSS